MKKYVITICSICLCLISLIALPVETKAQTISEFQAEVEKYTKQLQEKQAKLAKNDQEIAAIKNKIASIERQISDANTEIETLQEEIDKSNKEIDKKSEESKSIMSYYQISNGDNIYLEYAFGASDITDMIYRMSIVEQLTEYNDKVMKELEALIKKNEERQQTLEEKKVELKNLENELEDQKERINADSASIRETMPGIQEQIKAAQANVTYFKSLGCGANEQITACQYRIQQANAASGGGSVPSTNGFYRPMQNGYITQGYSGYGGHLGVDLSSSNKSIEIYPIAAGQVFYNGRDSAGALVVKIKHNVGGRYIYSTYAHMRSVSGNMRVGANITENTLIGQMGSTGNSTGPHLHLEITTCDWNRGGGCTWSSYQKSTVNPTRYIALPSRWNNR